LINDDNIFMSFKFRKASSYIIFIFFLLFILIGISVFHYSTLKEQSISHINEEKSAIETVERTESGFIED